MNADPNRWGKYRIPTARKVGNDYTAGAFFVTWCVKGRVECLARIDDGQSFPTPLGMIVDEEWRSTARVRPNVTLDAWIVMPDHVHGILMIRPVEPARRAGSNAAGGDAAGEDIGGGLSLRRVHGMGETAHREETAHRAVSTGASRLWSGSLGAIIGQIKSIATKRIRAAGCPEFEWQTRFHDRILRNEAALFAARQYIADNPSRWEHDRDNPDGLFR